MIADSFLALIDVFLTETGMAESTFAKAAVGDPSAVARWRAGRSPTLRSIERVQAYMAAAKPRRGARMQHRPKGKTP